MRFVQTGSALFSTVILWLVTSHAVVAQSVGDRVRVVITGDTLTGDVIEVSETGFTITLWSGVMSGYESQRAVEYGQVEMLEVRTCCMDYARLATTVGGLLLGAGLGQLTNEQTCTDTFIILPLPTTSETCTRTGNNEIWGGLAGGAAGLLAGWAVLRERWEVIPYGDPSNRSLSPLVSFRSDYGRTTIMLGAQFRF